MDILTPSVLKALSKEFADLQRAPCEGIKVLMNEENISDIQAEIEGPTGTPYEGGLFRMKLIIGPEFPSAPPKGFFTTRIFHPNVSKEGEICVNVLKKDWKPDLGIRHVLLVVRCLLIEPNPDSALNEEAGRLLMEDYEEYARRARLMTGIHAAPPGGGAGMGAPALGAQGRRPAPLMPVCSNAEHPADTPGSSGAADSPARKATLKTPSAAAAAQKKAVKRL